MGSGVDGCYDEKCHHGVIAIYCSKCADERHTEKLRKALATAERDYAARRLAEMVLETEKPNAKQRMEWCLWARKVLGK